MNCINHPDIPAVAYCRTCGKALCEACQRTAQGTVYCAEHLPVAVPVPAGAPPYAQAAPAQSRPTGYTSVPPLPHLGTAPPWTGSGRSAEVGSQAQVSADATSASGTAPGSPGN